MSTTRSVSARLGVEGQADRLLDVVLAGAVADVDDLWGGVPSASGCTFSLPLGSSEVREMPVSGMAHLRSALTSSAASSGEALAALDARQPLG